MIERGSRPGKASAVPVSIVPVGNLRPRRCARRAQTGPCHPLVHRLRRPVAGPLQAGAELVSTSEGFDTSTPMGKASCRSPWCSPTGRGVISERAKATHRWRRETCRPDRPDRLRLPQGRDGSRGWSSTRSRPTGAAHRRLAARRRIVAQLAARLNEAGAPVAGKGASGASTGSGGDVVPGDRRARVDPDTEALIAGGWEPVIDPDAWQRLRLALAAPGVALRRG